ncbi:type II secretion system F family protein [Sansalvadorimonas sp. 2012CJ34-2]|uniref:Type II secretion system F family protein n=1 Tax=Parendozoicomonas callyspongiae TaxID=2942213 RepID=A0ABT0PCP2_9GAMM|nr:type II secretion system F family protein [Sansalvadorimonas sp. 2012CJ34-2]MCL6268522.1 type II secretion system F family protein [Sansalvadorimonas sp. 2012CJ34-2]
MDVGYLLLSLGVAVLPVMWINSYFSRQASRRWLGLSYTVTSWDALFETLEARFSYRRKSVERNLVQAGIYNSRVAALYLPAKFTLAAVIAASGYFFQNELGLVNSTDLVGAILIPFIVVIIGPDIWLQKRSRNRVRKVSGQLPYVVDLMAVCIQTGMTIESSIAYLSDELKGFDKGLARIMWQVDSRSRVIGIEQALEELLDQYPSNEMRSFVYTLNQSLQYGSSIFEVLTSLSSNIREVQMLELEEKVGKLSAKMSVPLILFIMFPIVILITAPGIMRMVSDGGPFG